MNVKYSVRLEKKRVAGDASVVVVYLNERREVRSTGFSMEWGDNGSKSERMTGTLKQRIFKNRGAET